MEGIDSSTLLQWTKALYSHNCREKSLILVQCGSRAICWVCKFKFCLEFLINVPSICPSYHGVLAHIGCGAEDAHSDPLCHCACLKKPQKLENAAFSTVC